MAHSSLRSHRKLMRLMRVLKLPRPHMVGHLECFWWSCYEAKSVGRNGILAGWSADDIASAAEFDGDGSKFVDALCEAGFLDRLDGAWGVHDYFDNAPEFVRKRIERAEKAGSVQTPADNNGESLPTQRNPTSGNVGTGNDGTGNVTPPREIKAHPPDGASEGGLVSPNGRDYGTKAVAFAQIICDALGVPLAGNQAQITEIYLAFAPHPAHTLIALSLVEAAKEKSKERDQNKRLGCWFKVSNNVAKTFSDPNANVSQFIGPKPKAPSPPDRVYGPLGRIDAYQHDIDLQQHAGKLLEHNKKMAEWEALYGPYVLEGVG